MKRRLSALLLAALLTAVTLAGCAKDDGKAQDAPDTEPAPAAEPAETTPSAPEPAVIVDDDTALITNGVSVSWDTFTYFANYFARSIMENGSVTTKDQLAPYADQILITCQRTCTSFGALELAAIEKLPGTAVSQNEVDTLWQSILSQYGTEEEAQKTLAENHMTEDVYKSILYYNTLSDKLFEAMYGARGEKLSDEAVAEQTASDGYMMAKHILLVTTETGEDGTQTDMSDEDKAAVREKLEGIAAQLQGLEGKELEAKFDELMLANTEDPGVQTNPGGYLFQNGDMVAEFQSATEALEEYGLSDIVATSYGYHLILRIPIDYDAIPSAYSMYQYYGYEPYRLSLRYLVAQSQFQSVIDGWVDTADVIYSDKMDDLDILSIIDID